MRIKFTQGTDEDGLGIPYPKEIDAELHNLGYFDLKKEPQRIAEIYELAGWPEFQEFIALINRKDSFFKSLRCDVWFASLPQHPQFTRIAVGYVTIAFENMALNLSKENYEALRQRFKDFAAQYPPNDQITLEFKHIPTSYNEQGIARAWSEDIEIHGLGNTDDEAGQAWLAGLRVVQAFIVQENAFRGGN